MHQPLPRLHQSDVNRGVPGERARHGRAGIGMALAAVAILASGIGCASGGSSADPAPATGGGAAAAPAAATGRPVCDYGCLVPGPRVASQLSISATDTLTEINPRTTLRSPLQNAITQHIQQNGWSSGRCLRKFGGPNVFVVLFHRGCEAGPDPGPGMVVGFQANGQVIGQVTWNGPQTVAHLNPPERR